MKHLYRAIPVALVSLGLSVLTSSVVRAGPYTQTNLVSDGSVPATTIVGLEAILLASFLLMRQTRVSRRAEERDHLMLQLLLLTEKEVTAVLSLERQIAKQLGLEDAANRSEVRELSRDTSIDEMAQTIKEALPTK